MAVTSLVKTINVYDVGARQDAATAGMLLQAAARDLVWSLPVLFPSIVSRIMSAMLNNTAMQLHTYSNRSNCYIIIERNKYPKRHTQSSFASKKFTVKSWHMIPSDEKNLDVRGAFTTEWNNVFIRGLNRGTRHEIRTRIGQESIDFSMFAWADRFGLCTTTNYFQVEAGLEESNGNRKEGAGFAALSRNKLRCFALQGIQGVDFETFVRDLGRVVTACDRYVPQHDYYMPVKTIRSFETGEIVKSKFSSEAA